jgi:hypothetical protein
MACAPFLMTFDVHGERNGGQDADKRDVVGGELFDGKGEDGADDVAKIVFAELKLDRAAEVDEHLHDAIEAVNLGLDNLEMA